jgi:CheY-like chemotaxis protein
MTDPRSIILVVEDEPIIRMGAVALVTDAGFEALEASNADDAIRLLEARDDIRLVFTDINMPGTMDGIKLTHFIRDRWPPIKLLVASGKTILEESEFPQGVRLLSKPYASQTIIEAMIALLDEPSD